MSHANARLTPAGRLILVERNDPGRGGPPDASFEGHGREVVASLVR